MDPKETHPKFHLFNLQYPSKAMVLVNSLAQMLLTIHHKLLLSQVMGCPQPLKQLMEINLSLVMDLDMEPPNLKSQVALHLHMDNHNHPTQQVAMVNQGIPLPNPHHLVIPNQKQALKEHHHLVTAVLFNKGMVPHHMVLQLVANLVMVKHHHHTAVVPMVLVILSPQHILLMVMQV